MKKTKEWLSESAKYQNTYYGQLAFSEIRPGEAFSLVDQPKVSEKFQESCHYE